MKKLSFLFAALMACTLSFAASYVQVTDASTLKEGDVIVIGSADNSKVAAAIGNGKFLTAADAKFSDGVVALDDAYEIKLSGDAKGWTLTSSEGVIGSTAAKAMAIDNTKATNTWTIEIAEGKATITCACGEFGRILYNKTSPRFLNYTSDLSTNMLLPELYMKETGPAVNATAVAFDQSAIELEQYKYSTLKVMPTPADATDEWEWASDNESVATVNQSGKVTIVAAGTANITVTSKTTATVTATCVITAKVATPITVAQAVEIAKTVSANNEIAAGGMYVIRGYVTELYGTPSSDLSKYGNYSVWLADAADGGKVFEAYQVVPTDGKTVVEVGDYVEVIADITKYNDTYETVGKTGTIQMLSMRGSYTVGTTDNCDYASLAAAFTAYNTKAADGMVTGDVTLQIASNLTEAKNVGIQNPTDYTLTITVDKAAARTISFSQAADNAGPSGNICIGCDMTLAHTSASVASKNVIIDGAYNGSEESYLTIKSVSGCHKLNGPVLIYGNVTNCTVKNCNLIAENGLGSSLYPVTIRSQKETDNAPKNILIDNNHIEAIKGTSDQGIYLQLTTTGKVKPSDITISNNEIVARTRGIFMNGAKNVLIDNNTIKMQQVSDGMLSHAIWGLNDIEGTVTIQNNQLTELTTGATKYDSTNKANKGIVGIETCGGASWVIRNNYISGFNLKAESADNITVLGIVGATWANSIVIEHNTLALADQACAITNVVLEQVCLVKSSCKNSTIQNNLLVSNEADFNNALIRPAGTLAGNVYCTQSYIGSADSIKTLVDYKAFYEATAKTVASVEFANLAKGDLDLAGASDGDVNLGVDALEAVPTDINGTVRAAYTYAGAYEGTELTKPSPATGMDEVEAADGVQKIVRDGQVLILRDGKTYNVMGQVVE